jgi:hypothetical protein
VISGLAGTIITGLYGADVAPAAHGARRDGVGDDPLHAHEHARTILFATGNQAFDLKVNVIATLTSVLLNVALIPQWGSSARRSRRSAR